MSNKPSYKDLEQRIKELEIELHEQGQAHKAMELFFNGSSEMHCVIGFDRKFKRVNAAWHNILGFSEDELVGSYYTDFIHPEDINVAVETGKKCKETGTPVVEFKNRYK